MLQGREIFEQIHLTDDRDNIIPHPWRRTELWNAEGDRLIYQLQRQGTSRSVSGTPPFRLFLGFADGVEIEVDGQPLTIPVERRLGNTARFQIPLTTDDVGRR